MNRRQPSLLTGSLLTSRVAQWSARGPVKAISSGLIQITNSTTTATATIPAVVLTYTHLELCGADSTDGTNYQPRIEVTNTTTLTATRVGSTNASNINYGYVEYFPGIVNVQRGTVAVTAGVNSGTATINAVTTTRAYATYLGQSTTDGAATSSGMAWWSRLTLTNSTTVTASRQAISNTFALTVGYEVPEWVQ